MAFSVQAPADVPLHVQENLADVSRELTREMVAAKLDIHALPSSDVFRVADLRISYGPNDFTVAEDIIRAVEPKYRSLGDGSTLPKVEVFYNHQTPKDFTQLLCSLPADREYYAACVSGSFYNRLFPAASLHLVHCSDSLQWLSKVPVEVVDRNSAAWNGNGICYSDAGDEVISAYRKQYERDMEYFLNARSQEVVPGGLMVILVPGRPSGTPHPQASANMILELLGSCLLDMANKGMITGEKVESFNLPLYITSPEEVEEVVSKNGRFSIERMEILPHQQLQGDISLRAKLMSSHLRAGVEGYVKKHFGEEILNELFDLLTKKLEQSPVFETGKTVYLFVLLKRKAN